ncbi:MAG: hypothetical protein E6K80_03460 [Candidatus Eisenbacteria bacterium]|uniref:Uncharacterized protein n=1 Tax=Eiseniibacteriota bacterium TaxID=2212470 RepID=A0A538U8C1_UNCEI|nr:MAG: hypothetical protein E6K80_03460 [Candidatus Eisenbacteria bacterium]
MNHVMSCLLVAAALLPHRIAAEEPRADHLQASPRAFALSDVMLTFELSRPGQSDPGAVDAPALRYRVRVVDESGAGRWDSDWIGASPLCAGAARLVSVHVGCRADSATAEIGVDVTLESDGHAYAPSRFLFYRWADGRYRGFPEPQPWPDRAALLPMIDERPRVALEPIVVGIAPAMRSLPRESWGRLKSRYR